ncbi:caspase activity and apoptosis inhibitor 1 isoform X2 [Hemicordylus capensis]|uniref:caspase activity and apoptosis inhibitor 1 isoform X2 n=1 Tax=Hemicordylus capensis TaxID=884348 RepID=UPI002304CA18|nr:caspase activity and apoptosis inhibitor 1 isoform X2 [Hemicordylus capensis]
MTGRKLSKEKKRHRSRLCCPEEGGGSERKRRSTDSLHGLQEEAKCTTQVPEKEDAGEEHTDIEEGGLDLSVQLKPVSFYITDKKEMLHQCFCIIGEKKLQKMLPDILKVRMGLTLTVMKRLMVVKGRQQLNHLVSKGEDSDVLSINADAYDSDIEGPCNEEDNPDVPERTVRSGDGQIDDLQKDIEKSVNEILGLAESSPKDSKAGTLAVPPTDDVQPSAQQLELLELEMRARAIKALMKAGDVKK